uniref:Nucleobase ascorbate transporter n=1 Tax=Arundo donax TaxID=35708 RepID=A0A0A9E7F5_ARUDO
MFLEGIFGAPAGSSVSVENIGLLGLTKVGSRRVIQISTGFMIFFSIFGKFGAFFASIPLPIFAAIYCILFGIVAAVGVSFMQFANKNSMRNIYIIGLSLFLGISIPQYFNEYTSSANHGPARTNAGWVYCAFPFTPVTIAILFILTSPLYYMHMLFSALPHWCAVT